jgi:hypothetical protein
VDGALCHFSISFCISIIEVSQEHIFYFQSNEGASAVTSVDRPYFCCFSIEYLFCILLCHIPSLPRSHFGSGWSDLRASDLLPSNLSPFFFSFELGLFLAVVVESSSCLVLDSRGQCLHRPFSSLPARFQVSRPILFFVGPVSLQSGALVIQCEFCFYH